MIIRKCTEEDLPAVGRFYDGVVKYLCEHINYPLWVYRVYPSEDSAREMIREGSQFICLEGDRIVGTFVLNDDPGGTYEDAAWEKELPPGAYMVCHALASAADLRGRGIGKKMVQFCIDYAKDHGYRAVRLDVVPTNIPARRLYESCGFRYAGDVDLKRDIGIPLFSMYELNF